MTASGRGSRSDSFERQEGFALPGESVRLRRPVRSRGVAGCPRRKGSVPRSRRGGKVLSHAFRWKNTPGVDQLHQESNRRPDRMQLEE